VLDDDGIPLLAGLADRNRILRAEFKQLQLHQKWLPPGHAEITKLLRREEDRRGSAATYDPIGVAYGRLTEDDRERTAAGCVPFSLSWHLTRAGRHLTRAGSTGRVALTDEAALADELRQLNDSIMVELRRLAARNDTLDLLRCARRVPNEWIQEFLGWIDPQIDGETSAQIRKEGPLLAANVVLEQSRVQPEPPPEPSAVLRDGIRVRLLCALQRWHVYRLNTAVRWLAFGRTGDTASINAYVRRSQRALDVRDSVVAHAREGSKPGIIGITAHLPGTRQVIRLTASKRLKDQRLELAHYLPITIPPNLDQHWIAYLTHQPSAAEYLGELPFERWWCCWLALNAAAWQLLQIWDPPDSTDATDSSVRTGLRLYAEAHNLGMIEVQCDRLREAVLGQQYVEAPTAAEYDSFVDSLTWKPGGQGRPRRTPDFLESPVVFYPTGPDTSWWDLTRHGGVLPGLARWISMKRSDLGRHVGAHFEGRVHQALSGHPAVTGLRSDVLLPNQIQIDHGFVLGDVLVLVESKSYVKTAGYFVAHGGGFTTRAKRIVGETLSDRDTKLQTMTTQIAAEWASWRPRCALFIACTIEVEYIPGREPGFWLDLDQDIPRACTLPELLRWLDIADRAELAAHPASVALNP
jgi:hypothetical protein